MIIFVGCTCHVTYKILSLEWSSGEVRKARRIWLVWDNWPGTTGFMGHGPFHMNISETQYCFVSPTFCQLPQSHFLSACRIVSSLRVITGDRAYLVVRHSCSHFCTPLRATEYVINALSKEIGDGSGTTISLFLPTYPNLSPRCASHALVSWLSPPFPF